MTSDGFVCHFISFLFSPLFYSISVSDRFWLERGPGRNYFCHWLAALSWYQNTVALALPKIQVMPHKQMKVFSELLLLFYCSLVMNTSFFFFFLRVLPGNDF